MIYTVTLNPSLDYIVTVDEFKSGMTNRTSSEQLLPGGKGINVSTVLHNLEMPNVALGFCAGFTGDEIIRKLDRLGVQSDFLMLENGYSRINMKIKNIDGTEINGMGPDIDSRSLEMLMEKLDPLEDGDVLVLAGAIPKSVSSTIYKDIMKRLENKDVLIAVDATKDLLMNVLEYKPFLIKPNNHELGEIFGVTLTEREDVIPYARELQKKGAANVLVSMAGKGAVLLAKSGEVYMAPAPKGNLVNAVGAGDSMVAGFIAGWLKTEDYEKAFKMGVAAGSASAFSENLATQEEVMAVYQQVEAENYREE